MVHSAAGQIGGWNLGANEPWIAGRGHSFLTFGHGPEASFFQDELGFVSLGQDGDDDDYHFHRGGTG